MSESKLSAPAQPVEQTIAPVPSAGAQSDQGLEATHTAASAIEATVDFGPAAAAAANRSEYDFLAPPQSADELGRLGGYRVLGVLGEGGMGVVFEAEDAVLRRRIALKAMKPRLAANAEARQRFIREAQTAASVEHENIVAILQVGDDRGVPFIAMPLLRGETLANRMHWHDGAPSPEGGGSNAGDTPLPLADIVRIGREVAAGLAAAHEQGLIHRDVKPANIWLEAKTGRVKLLDFGLARANDEEQHLTQTGVVLGTPSYMSPEQARGEPVDHRTDLFSLGCVLYHVSTGRRPFRGTSAISTLLAVATIDPAAAATVNPCLPKALGDLIRELMAKDRTARPASAAKVVERLLAIECGRTLAPTEDGPPGPSSNEPDGLGKPSCAKECDSMAMPSSETACSPPNRRRGRWPQTAAAAAAAAALLAGVIVVIKDRDGKVVATVETKEGANVKAEPPYTVEVRPSEAPSGKRAPAEGGAKASSVPLPEKSSIDGIDFAPGPDEGYLPGIVPRPAKLPGIGRWQVATRMPRGGIFEPHRLAFSPGGRWLGLAAGDGHVRLYDVAARRLARVLAGQQGSVECIAWSANPDVFATGGTDREVRLWSVTQAKTTAVLQGHTTTVTDLAWSRAGLLASGAGHWGDARVRIWNIKGEQQATIDYPGGLGSLAWSPDAQRLAVGGSRGILLANSAGKQDRLLDNDVPIQCMTFSPDGNLLAAGRADGSVRVWNTADWTHLAQLETSAESEIKNIGFSPDSQMLVALPYNGRAIFCKVGAPTWSELAVGRGLTLRSLDWNSDPPLLALADTQGNVHFYDRDLAASGSPLRAVPVARPVLNRHGVSAAATGAGKVRLADLNGLRNESLQGVWGGSLEWSPDGKLLVGTCYKPRGQWVWDVERSQLYANWPVDSDGRLNCVRPDGQRLATAGTDQPIRVWSIEGEQLAESVVVGGKITALSWRPDGQQLAALLQGEGRVQLFDATDANRLLSGATTALPMRAGAHIEWSRSGRYLLAAGQHVAVFEPERSHVFHLSALTARTATFSPDERTVAEGMYDGTCRLFSIEGEAGLVLRGHLCIVSGVRFIDDGKHLVSAADDNTLIKWDAATGKPLLATLILPDDQLIVFGPGGDVRFATEHAKNELLYIIEEPSGEQVMQTPAEFRARLNASARSSGN